MRTPIEHYDAVLLRATEQLVARTLGDSFHKHFVSFSDATLVGLSRQAILQSDNLIQAADFHIFGHIVFEMFGSIRSRTFGIFEHESSIVSALFHQGERESVVFLRFGVETGEYIRCQSAIGNDTFDSGHTVQIPFSGIFAVHQFQDTGAAALHG